MTTAMSRNEERDERMDDSSSFDDSDGFDSGGNSSHWDDSSEDPITRVSSRGRDDSRHGYRFQADADGVVTSLKRIRDNRVKNEKIEAGETWLFNRSTGQLIHREFGEAGTEIKTYADNDGDGIFTRTFKTMSPFATSVVDGF